MFSVMHQYKLRLTNLSQANRSLKLQKLSVRKDVDLLDLGFLNQLSAAEILGRVVAGQSVTLLKQLSARDEPSNLADRRLNKVWNEVKTIYEESGTDDLFIGYPFVEGKFLDGSIARCPVVLFPVRLRRDFQGGPRWVLEPNSDEDLSFNTTFFLAYEKFMQVRLPKEFWEDGPERGDDLQAFLNGLYKKMADYNITVHFNSELFQFQVDRFPDKNQAVLDGLPLGKLRFLPHAVLGIFPQSDSALMQDYEVLEAQSSTFSLEEHFKGPSKEAHADVPREDERYFVTAVDQSQEEALLRVRAGESVVVHGPPGTGKSQVILNLISDALARGKKVLVCSQKRAALDVVFQRLSEVGLGRFAALVHDYRGDRNKIFARIKQQIDDIDLFQTERRDFGLEGWQRDFQRDSRRIDEFGHDFEKLFASLTTRGEFGLSPHELYLMADPKIVPIDMGNVAIHLDYEGWVLFREKLAAVFTYADLFAEDHPWRHRQAFVGLQFNSKTTLQQRLRELDAWIGRLNEQWSLLGNAGKYIREVWEVPGLIGAFEGLEVHAASPGAKQDLASAVAGNLTPQFLLDHLVTLGKLFQQLADFKLLDGMPINGFAEFDRQFSTYDTGRQKVGRFFSPRWIQSWWFVRKMLNSRGRRVTEVDVALMREEAKVLGRLAGLAHELRKHAFFLDMPMDGNPATLSEWHARKVKNVDLVLAWHAWQNWPSFRPAIVDERFDEGTWQAQVNDVAQLRTILNGIEQFGEACQGWLHPRQVVILGHGFSDPASARHYLKLLESALTRDFEDLCHLDTLLAGLDPNQRMVLSHVEPRFGDFAKAEFLDAVEQGLLHAWLAIMESEDPELLEPSSRQMPERMEAYRAVVKQRLSTVAGLIQRKLKDAILEGITVNRLKNPVAYRDIGHQVRKQRQLWPVRKLVQEFWEDGLSTLIPCWMASPESVSAIFPMVKGHFDLVIFDEASQCYVERALPVMLRARQCVIAGDDKQLPPFDLYNLKADEDEDPFHADQMALEVESILDLARNKFGECKLSWHYRSSERALINFSNHAFYEGRLNVIPPAKHDAISQPPISFVKVEGVWEQNANVIEAREVVRLVEVLVKHPENPTIGIVTFNFHQKELIRTLLEERLEQLRQAGETESLAMLYKAMEREEGEERLGIFVKNIENVQGDERDVMIFSVGYARNAAGKLIANFGLLNQKGGGNRLNVAITRAKKKKIIVSSIEPEDLHVEQAAHEGPLLLKRYLQYAKALSADDGPTVLNVLGQLRVSPKETDKSVGPRKDRLRDIVSILKSKLEAKGLQVEQNLGESNFVLDLAIIGKSGEYVLGIEVEGRNYFLGRSAKEREVYRPVLLEMRGWQLHRVWARNFFLDVDAEVARIMEKVAH